MQLSDEKLLELWRDPSFSGSFRGVRNFQTLLKTDLNVNVSEKRLLNLLKTDPIFLIHQRPKPILNRRKYNVNFYGQLVQIDIAFMFEDSETKDKAFLIAVDAFSLKIFVEPLKDKTTPNVLSALKKIFAEFDHPIYEIQSDMGKEFKNVIIKKFLKEHHTLLRFKRGKNKASFAEYGILLVKRRLYMILRSELSQKWVSYLKTTVQGLNNTPMKRLGWLTPSSIKDERDSVRVQNAKSQEGINVIKPLTYKQQSENQLNYKGDLQKEDYVYLDFPQKIFDKSFDVSVKSEAFFHDFQKRTPFLLKNYLKHFRN